MNKELIEQLKSQVGVDGERRGSEYCTVFDEEWAELISTVLDAVKESARNEVFPEGQDTEIYAEQIKIWNEIIEAINKLR